MQFLQKHIFLATTLGSIFLFTACAPESKYNGGSGALHSYESMDAYGSSTIKYRTDYTEPAQSSFSSTLVANDRDNIRKTHSSTTNTQAQSGASKNNIQNTAQAPYESPVQGNGGFTPTESLLGGMRDSEAIQRATMRPYTVRGKTYRPHPVKVGDTFDGVASWYGPDFHAKATSNGETYNMYAHTAANKTLPMNTIVKVYNKDNGKTTIVRINDRGPFVEGRIIDLSNIAARDIAMVGKGVANVRIEVVGFGGNLKNNTPPANPNSIDSIAKDSNTQAKQPQETSHKEFSSQDRAVLKPRSENKQPSIQENTQQYNPQPINTESSSKETYAENISNANAISQNTTQQQPAQVNIPQVNSQTIEDKEANNDTSLSVSEEELPLFDTDKQQAKPSKSEKQTPKPENQSPAASENDAIESAFTNVVPKRIDNTESLKDIDMAMQKLKDSTDDIAKKVQEENAKKANANNESANKANEEKEEALSKQANKDSKESKEQTPQDTKIADGAQQKEDKKETKTNKQNISNFMVSLNVFSSEDRAKNFQDESSEIAKNTPYTIDIVPTDKGLYRVALRGFKTHEEAKAFITQHNINGHVVQEQ